MATLLHITENEREAMQNHVWICELARASD